MDISVKGFQLALDLTGQHLKGVPRLISKPAGIGFFLSTHARINGTK